MTRIAVTADLHVDDFPGIPGRFDDMLGTVGWVAHEARDRGAAALVVAGDYSEQKRPIAAARTVKIADALADGPATQVHVQGNHDVAWRGSSIVDDLARTPGWWGFTKPGFTNIGRIAVCAIPFLDRAWWRAQPGNELKPEADAFRELAADYLTIARGLYAQATSVGCEAAILVGHQQLAGAAMTDQQRVFLGDVDLVIDARALAAIGYRAVVFGHVHRGQTVIDDPDCPVIYVGSPERVDFAEEAEEKSFVLVDVDRDRPVSIERIPTPARRFVTLEGDRQVTKDEVAGAIVRCRQVAEVEPLEHFRAALEDAGVFAITDLRHLPAEAEAPAAGMDESLSAEQLLEEYFAGDPDRVALLDMGRQLLAEVGS